MQDSENGIRINKFLSEAGVCSRREADREIEAGNVRIGERVAVTGDRVMPEDQVFFRERPVKKEEEMILLVVNKPAGIVCTAEKREKNNIVDFIHYPKRIYPVGRLDKDSEGLLLLTNDGTFANGIMHPSRHISKTYRVTVRPDVTEEQLVTLSQGMELDGKMTMPATVVVKTKEPGRVVLLMTIQEGRNRQIRRMCEAVGLEVARLRRISVGPVKLGMLKPGTYRDLTPDELRALRNAIGKGEADGAKPKPAKSKPRTAGARSKSGNPNKPRNRR